MTESRLSVARTRTITPADGDEPDACGYLLVLVAESSSVLPLPRNGAILIGRVPEAEICLDDDAVSRRHARIVVADGAVAVTDLGSHNGTQVNGERIRGARALFAGDVVTVGNAQMVVHGEGAPAEAPLLDAAQLRRHLGGEVQRALAHERPLALVVLALTAPPPDVAPVATSLRARLRLDESAGWLTDTRLAVVLSERDEPALAALVAHLEESLEPLVGAVRAGVALCPRDGGDAGALIAAATAAAAGAPPGGTQAASALPTRLDVGGRTVVVADEAMVRLYELLRRLARSELPVLITGETGAGKENAAFAVHAFSPRAAKTFVTVNCAALPEALAESELFGHERGAFSGAVAAKVGLLEAAAGGTLFLDEVGELSPAVQAKLLRALETKRILRVGATQERAVDLRITAATNRDLERESDAGRFRRDLFYRLSAATVVLPPLRHRPREVAVLARLFLDEACARVGRAALELAPGTLARLAQHTWPGNVRELKNAMEYVAAAVEESLPMVEPWHLPGRLGSTAALGHLAATGPAPVIAPPAAAAGSATPSGGAGSPPASAGASAPPLAPGGGPTPAGVPAAAPTPIAVAGAATQFRPLADELRDLERRRIAEALAASNGVQKRAAELLDMPLRTLVLRIREYGLQRGQRPAS
jgi:transcriptional regulator with GAF, ATPase, and Fis domain